MARQKYDFLAISQVTTMPCRRLGLTDGLVRPLLLQFYENEKAASVAFSRAREGLVVIARCGTIAQVSMQP